MSRSNHNHVTASLARLLLRSALSVCAVWIAWPLQASDRDDALDYRIARIEGGLLPASTAGVVPAPPWNIHERMRLYNVPGVSIAVIHNYTLEWVKGYGVLEAGGVAPVTDETLFQAASISKPVTAMGILRLAQEGRLRLDGEANQYLSTWRIPENQFTVRQKVFPGHLLTHTAGMTPWGYTGYFFDQPLPVLTQILDGQRPPANSAPIRVERVPGTEFVYSNGGFLVLQQMAMDITGLPFDTWIKSTVLDRLEMTRTSFVQPLPQALEANAARGHLSNGAMIRGGWKIHPELASSGMWTTAADLARLVIEIQRSYFGRSNRVLSPEMTRLMLTPFAPSYGLGMQLESEGAFFYHSGANDGYRALILGYPHTGDGAVILTNADSGAELRQEIARAIATEYGWAHFRVAGFPAGAPVLADRTPVLNAASSKPEAAPGTIVSIYGPDLDGVTEVLFQGQKAAILAATAGQVNAIVPAGIAPGLALLQVRRGGLTSRGREVRIATSAPGLFSLNQRGDGPGIIVHADNFRLVSETEPAHRGGYVSILCTGLGVNGVEPAVTVGGSSARVSWSGPMPGFPGVDQINIQVPFDAPHAGSVPIQLRAGTAASNTVTIAID